MTDEPEGREKGKRERRDCVLPRTRCTGADLAALKDKAQSAGLSQGETLRRGIHQSVLVVREPLADVAHIRQLSGIANNLNQLTRSAHIHEGLDLAQMDELKDVLSIIRGLISGLTDGS